MKSVRIVPRSPWSIRFNNFAIAWLRLWTFTWSINSNLQLKPAEISRVPVRDRCECTLDYLGTRNTRTRGWRAEEDEKSCAFGNATFRGFGHLRQTLRYKKTHVILFSEKSCKISENAVKISSSAVIMFRCALENCDFRKEPRRSPAITGDFEAEKNTLWRQDTACVCVCTRVYALINAWTRRNVAWLGQV